MSNFLGLDIGTGSAKAVLLNEAGVAIAEASAAYRPVSPKPGWSEIDVETWWQAIIDCARQLPAEARNDVGGIGFSGQMHGVVLCDANSNAVRPAILWLDGRAGGVLSRYPQDSLARVGNNLSPGMAGPLLVWLQANEPEVLKSAGWALQPKDWLRLRLTGVANAEPSDASGTLLAQRDGNWDFELIDALGLPRAIFAPMIGSADRAGSLTKRAAEALGLPPGIPVAAGGGDTPVAAIGSGLLTDGAAQLTTGSGAQIVVLQKDLPAPSPSLNCYRAVSTADLPHWYVMAAMQNAGVALEWARSTLGLSWDEAYSQAFDSGSAHDREVFFLPHLSGERTPWMNTNLRGAWVGMNPASTRGHLMHAAFVGVAFSIRAGLDALRTHGIRVDSLRLAGGGSVHKAWQQLLMDVLQLPLDAVACPNASARGAAILGGFVAGHWKTDDLFALAPGIERLGEPLTTAYESSYVRFCDLNQRLTGWFEQGS
ncbi:MAG: carbohydrate kinase [Propionivibrio sp.]|nr:carbohydrate kinase [Propionivibrio sp.]